jgi:serine/threonine protein kinase
MGKKHYMSPEQLLALNVDGASDVFAMGVVLYELLTLEPLFYEDATELLIDEVTWRPLPDVREHNPGVPAALADVLTNALDRDAARRPSAQAMGRALDKWCESVGVVATPDKLQEHLASIFPASYQPPSVGAEHTRFSNFKHGLRRVGERDSWLRRVWKAMRS